MPPRRVTRANPRPPVDEVNPREVVAPDVASVDNPVNPAAVEDFGRDKDLKALLRSLQPKDCK